MYEELWASEPYLASLARQHVTASMTLGDLAVRTVRDLKPLELLDLLQDASNNVDLAVDSVTYGIQCLLCRAAVARYKELTGEDKENPCL